MKGILICPSDRPEIAALSQERPLAAMPVLGQSLLEYWLAHLATSGREIMVLAADRPALIEAIVGGGTRWGVKASVVKESRELTEAQALIKYDRELDPAILKNGVAVMDHFPTLPGKSLMASYESWFTTQLDFISQAKTPERVGIRQTGDQVWMGLHSHVSPSAKINGPCWIGRNVVIGPGCIIGPNAIIEDGAFVEAAARVADSYIGPDTFVGKFNEVTESVALGSTLINWLRNSVTTVPDPFLLSALRGTRAGTSPGLLARVSELYARNKVEMQLFWKHFLMNKEG